LWSYKPTSKLASDDTPSAYQPISVIFAAPAGATSLTANALQSAAVLPPAGSAVGASVTNPQFVPFTKPGLL